MELTLRIAGFVPGVALRMGRFNVEFSWPFARVGPWSLWVERTGHRPENGKWFEVWQEDATTTHLFGFGRRVLICREG